MLEMNPGSDSTRRFEIVKPGIGMIETIVRTPEKDTLTHGSGKGIECEPRTIRFQALNGVVGGTRIGD